MKKWFVLMGSLMGVGFVASVYLWPRFLSLMLGERSPWISYLYTYGLGSLFFFITLFLIYTLRRSHKDWKKRDRYWVLVLMGLLSWGVILHATWIVVSIVFPFKG